MFTERQEKVVALLKEKQMLSMHQLAEALYVSEASVRRDVGVLAESGAVQRVYGGVMLSSCEKTVVPLEMRDGEHSAQKEQLARRAAEMVEDGDTILMDASSTVRRMAKYLLHRHHLTVITNNLRLMDELKNGDARIFCTGGEYMREDHAYIGPAAERFIRSVTADKMFFSSQGVSITGEISDHSESETSLRRAMLDRSKRKICLMDGSKIGITCVFSLCGQDEVDDFICNTPLPWSNK